MIYREREVINFIHVFTIETVDSAYKRTKVYMWKDKSIPKEGYIEMDCGTFLASNQIISYLVDISEKKETIKQEVLHIGQVERELTKDDNADLKEEVKAMKLFGAILGLTGIILGTLGVIF